MSELITDMTANIDDAAAHIWHLIAKPKCCSAPLSANSIELAEAVVSAMGGIQNFVDSNDTIRNNPDCVVQGLETKDKRIVFFEQNQSHILEVMDVIIETKGNAGAFVYINELLGEHNHNEDDLHEAHTNLITFGAIKNESNNIRIVRLALIDTLVSGIIHAIHESWHTHDEHCPF